MQLSLQRMNNGCQRRIYFWIHYRSSRPEVFLRKGVLKICSKFTGERPYRRAISIKFIEIALRHARSPVNLLHIFRTPVPKNTSGWLLLSLAISSSDDSTFSNFLDSSSRLDVILPKRASKDSVKCHFSGYRFKAILMRLSFFSSFNEISI